MPAVDALALSGVLIAMGVTALAAGFVGGLLCSIREKNRRSASSGRWAAADDDRPEGVVPSWALRSRALKRRTTGCGERRQVGDHGPRRAAPPRPPPAASVRSGLRRRTAV